MPNTQLFNGVGMNCNNGDARASQIRGARQEADAQKVVAAWQEVGVPADRRWHCDRRWWLNERWGHWQTGGNTTTSQMREDWKEAKLADVWLRDNQPS